MNHFFFHFAYTLSLQLSYYLYFRYTLSLYFFYFYLFIIYPIIIITKVMPCFKCCNSRSPLPFPIDLSPITHFKALPD
ncbi:hypothetical protein HanRHA438_Chr08g0366271 [Helianthus annuus]|nr:hypothetical protein HanHA300_Chr08g0292361 [Helianthus annuus]KAJ0554677.1 hypothetical protein HanHA89_Chr08g0310851 [Helianthus annuus]KAJ0720239.1 hypothetical protein HanLR1_Chr08g0291131 [Helianthus annuus]KAJ0723460.1 hypothetical protein HanOQP8_Chr08g0298561 [Helianthus annuus]KAJ0899246.1 hypothetical protein HanRHA438_Chr08g0366271 [Helianthus annuus]